MILSDRDIRAQLAGGRVVIDPLDDNAVQPSSVDLRVGDTFRVFANHRRSYIDVRDPMEDLTEDVKATPDEPFMLHPGEFVLGTTLERIELPEDLVGRVEGKSSLGRLGLLIHSSLPGDEELLVLTPAGLVRTTIGDVVKERMPGRVVGFDPETFEVGYHEISGWYEGPADRIFEVRLRSGRSVRVTAGHNLFTVDRGGRLTKVRTQQLLPGVRVAIAGAIGDPGGAPPTLDLLALVPEEEAADLCVEGPTVASLFASRRPDVVTALRDAGIGHARYYELHDRLPWPVLRQFAESAPGPSDRVRFRGARWTLPGRIPVDPELAWLLGIYVAEGYCRRQQVVVSNTDEGILDRIEAAFAGLGVPTYRNQGHSITAMSALFAAAIRWMGCGGKAKHKRVPTSVFGWPESLLEPFLEGFTDGGGSREQTRDSLWTSSHGLVSDLLLLLSRVSRRGSASYRIPSADSTAHDLDRLVDGDLLWDEVVEVRDTGRAEPVFDLEVRPGGRHVENFLAGHGGVFVSNTAGFVDAGFRGHLTLELSNVANLPIAIYPGMRIGQLCLFRMTSPAERPYGSPELGSKYQGQEGPTPSRYFENFDR